MRFQITARHFKASESLQSGLQDEIDRLEKYYERMNNCHVILDAEKKSRMTAEITVTLSGATLVAKAQSDVMSKAIDGALTKIEKQLKRKNAQKHDHRSKPGKDKNTETIEEEEEF